MHFQQLTLSFFDCIGSPASQIPHLSAIRYRTPLPYVQPIAALLE
jgi:hypothetical protein